MADANSVLVCTNQVSNSPADCTFLQISIESATPAQEKPATVGPPVKAFGWRTDGGPTLYVGWERSNTSLKSNKLQPY